MENWSCKHVHNLPDKKPVKILSGVIFINKFPYQKIFCLNKICIELPAFKHQTCLFKRNTFRTQFDSSKAGTGYLIGILPRMGAAKIENIPVLFPPEN